MRHKTIRIIAFILAVIMFVGAINYNNIKNIDVGADDSNAYNILEIVKAPQFQQLSYLDSANRPIDLDDMTDADRIEFLSKYPIMTNLDSFDTKLYLDKNDLEDIYTTSKLDGYFSYTSTASADNYNIHLFEIGKSLDEHVKFYNLDLTSNEYVEVKSIFHDEDGKTHIVTDYDIDEEITYAYQLSQYFKVVGDDRYHSIDELNFIDYSYIFDTVDDEDEYATKNYIAYFTKGNENEKGNWVFNPTVIKRQYKYTDDSFTLNKEVFASDSIINNYNNSSSNIAYQDTTRGNKKLEESYLVDKTFRSSQICYEVIDENSKVMNDELDNNSILNKLAKGDKKAKVTVKTVDEVRVSDIDKADLVYFNNYQDASSLRTQLYERYNSDSKEIVDFSNLNYDVMKNLYDKVRNRKINIVFDSIPYISEFDTLNTARANDIDINNYYKLYALCVYCYPKTFEILCKSKGIDKSFLYDFSKFSELFSLLPELNEKQGISYKNIGVLNPSLNEDVASHNVFKYSTSDFLATLLGSELVYNTDNTSEVFKTDETSKSVLSALSYLIKHPVKADDMKGDEVTIAEVQPCAEWLDDSYWELRTVSILPYFNGKLKVEKFTTESFWNVKRYFDIVYIGTKTGLLNRGSTISEEDLVQIKNLVLTDNIQSTIDVRTVINLPDNISITSIISDKSGLEFAYDGAMFSCKPNGVLVSDTEYNSDFVLTFKIKDLDLGRTYTINNIKAYVKSPNIIRDDVKITDKFLEETTNDHELDDAKEEMKSLREEFKTVKAQKVEDRKKYEKAIDDKTDEVDAKFKELLGKKNPYEHIFDVPEDPDFTKDYWAKYKVSNNVYLYYDARNDDGGIAEDQITGELDITDSVSDEVWLVGSGTLDNDKFLNTLNKNTDLGKKLKTLYTSKSSNIYIVWSNFTYRFHVLGLEKMFFDGCSIKFNNWNSWQDRNFTITTLSFRNCDFSYTNPNGDNNGDSTCYFLATLRGLKYINFSGAKYLENMLFKSNGGAKQFFSPSGSGNSGSPVYLDFSNVEIVAPSNAKLLFTDGGYFKAVNFKNFKSNITNAEYQFGGNLSEYVNITGVSCPNSDIEKMFWNNNSNLKKNVVTEKSLVEEKEEEMHEFSKQYDDIFKKPEEPNFTESYWASVSNGSGLTLYYDARNADGSYSKTNPTWGGFNCTNSVSKEIWIKGKGNIWHSTFKSFLNNRPSQVDTLYTCRKDTEITVVAEWGTELNNSIKFKNLDCSGWTFTGNYCYLLGYNDGYLECLNLEDTNLGKHGGYTWGANEPFPLRNLNKLKYLNMTNCNLEGTWDIFNGTNNIEYIKMNKLANVSSLRLPASKYKLTYVDFSQCDFTGVTSFNGLFKDISNLQYVDFSQADFTGVTSFETLFQNTPNLQYVDFSNMIASDITTIKQMFNNSGIRAIDAQEFFSLIPNLQIVWDVFANTKNLEFIDISNLTLGNARGMFYNASIDYVYARNLKVTNSTQGMFNSTKFKYIDIKNMSYTGGNLTSTDGQFRSSVGEYVNFTGFSTNNSYSYIFNQAKINYVIADNMNFSANSDLTFSGLQCDYLSCMNSVFRNSNSSFAMSCKKFIRADNSKFYRFWYTFASVNKNVSYYLPYFSLRNVSFNQVSGNKNTIFYNSFIDYLDLSDSNLIEFRGTFTQYAFNGAYINYLNCESMKFNDRTGMNKLFGGLTCRYAYFNNAVLGKHNMFEGSSDVKFIDYDNAIISSVDTNCMQNMMLNTNVEYVSLRGLKNTNKQTILQSAFQGSTVKLVDFGTEEPLDFSSVTTIQNMFSNCTNLLEVIGFNKAKWGSSAVNVSWTFENCYKLKTCRIADFSKGSQWLGTYASTVEGTIMNLRTLYVSETSYTNPNTAFINENTPTQLNNLVYLDLEKGNTRINLVNKDNFYNITEGYLNSKKDYICNWSLTRDKAMQFVLVGDNIEHFQSSVVFDEGNTEEQSMNLDLSSLVSQIAPTIGTDYTYLSSSLYGIKGDKDAYEVNDNIITIKPDYTNGKVNKSHVVVLFNINYKMKDSSDNYHYYTKFIPYVVNVTSLPKIEVKESGKTDITTSLDGLYSTYGEKVKTSKQGSGWLNDLGDTVDYDICYTNRDINFEHFEGTLLLEDSLLNSKSTKDRIYLNTNYVHPDTHFYRHIENNYDPDYVHINMFANSWLDKTNFTKIVYSTDVDVISQPIPYIDPNLFKNDLDNGKGLTLDWSESGKVKIRKLNDSELSVYTKEEQDELRSLGETYYDSLMKTTNGVDTFNISDLNCDKNLSLEEIKKIPIQELFSIDDTTLTYEFKIEGNEENNNSYIIECFYDNLGWYIRENDNYTMSEFKNWEIYDLTVNKKLNIGYNYSYHITSGHRYKAILNIGQSDFGLFNIRFFISSSVYHKNKRKILEFNHLYNEVENKATKYILQVVGDDDPTLCLATSDENIQCNHTKLKDKAVDGSYTGEYMFREYLKNISYTSQYSVVTMNISRLKEIYDEVGSYSAMCDQTILFDDVPIRFDDINCLICGFTNNEVEKCKFYQTWFIDNIVGNIADGKRCIFTENIQLEDRVNIKSNYVRSTIMNHIGAEDPDIVRLHEILEQFNLKGQHELNYNTKVAYGLDGVYTNPNEPYNEMGYYDSFSYKKGKLINYTARVLFNSASLKHIDGLYYNNYFTESYLKSGQHHCIKDSLVRESDLNDIVDNTLVADEIEIVNRSNYTDFPYYLTGKFKISKSRLPIFRIGYTDMFDSVALACFSSDKNNFLKYNPQSIFNSYLSQNIVNTGYHRMITSIGYSKDTDGVCTSHNSHYTSDEIKFLINLLADVSSRYDIKPEIECTNDNVVTTDNEFKVYVDSENLTAQEDIIHDTSIMKDGKLRIDFHNKTSATGVDRFDYIGFSLGDDYLKVYNNTDKEIGNHGRTMGSRYINRYKGCTTDEEIWERALSYTKKNNGVLMVWFAANAAADYNTFINNKDTYLKTIKNGINQEKQLYGDFKGEKLYSLEEGEDFYILVDLEKLKKKKNLSDLDDYNINIDIFLLAMNGESMHRSNSYLLENSTSKRYNLSIIKRGLFNLK